MKSFFKGVRKHIGRLDAEHLREQYTRVTDELAFSEMIFHTMNEGYIVLDAKGAPTWTNPAAERLAGMKIEDFLDTLEIAVGRATRREVEVTYPECRTLEIQTMPMGDETLVKLADVTANRERSEEELRAGATRAVRELASGVAHEIGNPLNAISLNLQLLERDPTDKESISICKRQIERLDSILKGFLQALKPSRPVLSAGSVVEPLRNCLSTLRAQFEERAVTVALEIDTTPPMVALDSRQIEQVYFNLLKNSLEAVHDGGKIRISVGADDENVNIVFADNGVGMNADQLVHLFEPYRTTKERGTGLGLMISQRIVRDHGGRIEVDSAVGRGTAFTVRLPRIERRIRRLKG